MSRQTAAVLGSFFGAIFGWLLICGPFIAAWLTHVITTIQTEQWIFLLAGAIFFPIGIIHGIGLWFGIF